MRRNIVRQIATEDVTVIIKTNDESADSVAEVEEPVVDIEDTDVEDVEAEETIEGEEDATDEMDDSDEDSNEEDEVDSDTDEDLENDDESDESDEETEVDADDEEVSAPVENPEDEAEEELDESDEETEDAPVVNPEESTPKTGDDRLDETAELNRDVDELKKERNSLESVDLTPELHDKMDELDGVYDDAVTLEEYRAELEDSLDDGGVSASRFSEIHTSVESIVAKYQSNKTIGLESVDVFGSGSLEAYKGTVVSIEGIKDAALFIYKKIKQMLKYLQKLAKEIISNFRDSKKLTRKLMAQIVKDMNILNPVPLATISKMDRNDPQRVHGMRMMIMARFDLTELVPCIRNADEWLANFANNFTNPGRPAHKTHDPEYLPIFGYTPEVVDLDTVGDFTMSIDRVDESKVDRSFSPNVIPVDLYTKDSIIEIIRHINLVFDHLDSTDRPINSHIDKINGLGDIAVGNIDMYRDAKSVVNVVVRNRTALNSIFKKLNSGLVTMHKLMSAPASPSK